MIFLTLCIFLWIRNDPFSCKINTGYFSSCYLELLGSQFEKGKCLDSLPILFNSNVCVDCDGSALGLVRVGGDT